DQRVAETPEALGVERRWRGRHGRAPLPRGSDAEEALLDRGLASERLRRALEPDAALVHHVEAVRERQGHLERLPDEQDRRTSPAKRTRPPRGRTTPMIESSVVVLPAPFRPISVTTSPSPTASETPCRTCASP